MKIKMKENYKVGVYTIFDIIGFDKEREFLQGSEVEVSEEELEKIESLPKNYKDAIEIIEEE